MRRRPLDGGLGLTHQFAPPGSASVSVTFVAPAGWSYDPSGSEGLAFATNRLLASGAGPWDRVALDRELDRLGATLGTRADPESAEVTVWGPSAREPELFRLLGEVVRRPRFALDDLERIRRQLVERQLREATQPGVRAGTLLGRALFPTGHPYRLSGTGTRRSIRTLTPEAVRRFHRDRYAAPGAMLIVTTSHPLERAVRLAAGIFGDLPGGSAAPPHRSGRSWAPVRPRTIRARMPARSQVEVRLGGRSVPRDDPAFPAVSLANEILGGRSLLSRLFQDLREKHGLAYHASSELQAMRWGGFWVAGAGTGPERVAKTVARLTAEVRRLARDPVGPSELRRIRESAIGELPLALETTAGAHELAVDLAYHDLPDDHLLTWPTTLRALSAGDVRRGAEAGLDASHAVTILAGPVAR